MERLSLDRLQAIARVAEAAIPRLIAGVAEDPTTRKSLQQLWLVANSTAAYLQHLAGGGEPFPEGEMQIAFVLHQVHRSLLPYFPQEPERLAPLEEVPELWDHPETWPGGAVEDLMLIFASVHTRLLPHIR